jgi:hypothetical protein
MSEREELDEISPEKVLRRVREAGGSLVLTGLDFAEMRAWRHAAKKAYLRLLRVGQERLSRYSDGPTTLRLRLVDIDDETSEQRREYSDAELEELFRSMRPPPVPPRTAEFVGKAVPVPSQVPKPHPLVVELVEAAERPERLFAERWEKPPPPRTAPVVRMTRIWQAILDEALFRGYDVRVDLDRYSAYDRGHLVVILRPDEYPISLTAINRGTLSLSLPSENRRRRGDVWTDEPDRRIETCLGELFTRMEQRADTAIGQRSVEQQRADERRRAWEAAMKTAKRQFTEDHRRQTVVDRIADVAFSDQARAYSRALQARAAELKPAKRSKVVAWADWIAAYADTIDPRRHLTGMPPVPDADPDELRAYLHGFSPYGPSHY